MEAERFLGEDNVPAQPKPLALLIPRVDRRSSGWKLSASTPAKGGVLPLRRTSSTDPQDLLVYSASVQSTTAQSCEN